MNIISKNREKLDTYYDESLDNFTSIKSVSSPQSYKITAILLTFFLIVFTLMLIYVPWQQSVTGSGKIIIFSPMDRPQNIESQIPARLRKWYIQDGQTVKKGELIAELSDLDPKFLDPEQSKRIQKQKEALIARREAAELRFEALKKQLESLKRSQNAALPSASERTHQTKDRIWAAEQTVEAAKQNTVTTKLNLTRIQNLFDQGLRSKRDLELAELEQTRALTDLERVQAALEIAKKDQNLAILDSEKIAADTDASLSGLSAAMASAQETIESTTSDIYKLDIELNNVRHRLDQRKVFAPCAGRIIKLMRVGAGETVDSGMVLATIAPETQDLAAELMISDNDVPLVAVGRPVRLQFAGWPALQFSGWPSIAVGTFGGKVAVIDATDDGRNSYRIIVKPDLDAIKKGSDEPWPNTKHLRPGAEVHAWIMLDTVSLGFELWRQFNAFPPTIKPEELGLNKSSNQPKMEYKRKNK